MVGGVGRVGGVGGGWRWLEVVGGRRNQSSGGGSAVNFYVRATSASSAVSQPTSVDPTLPPRS